MNAYTVYAVAQARYWNTRAFVRKAQGNLFAWADCKAKRLQWMEAARKAAAIEVE